MSQLMEMFGPPRLRLEGTGMETSVRSTTELRTSPRNTGTSDRIVQLPSSPEAVRAPAPTVEEESDEAEEVNE